LVFSIYDSPEEAIQEMIEASQRMISEQNNPIINEHFKLQIKMLIRRIIAPECRLGLHLQWSKRNRIISQRPLSNAIAKS
jgi:hypothetical protein